MKKIMFFLCSLIILVIFLLCINIKKIDVKNADRIPVITFHRLVPEKVKNTKYKDNVWVGSIDTFESMMKYIYENDYKTLSSDELYDWINKKIELPKKSVMITFDDGFYEDYYLVYPILKKYKLKATTFVVGSRIKEYTEAYKENNTAFIGLDKINEIRKDYSNFEIQSHSYDLHYYNKNGKHAIKSKSKEELEKDIINNEKYEFNVMAYPFGDYNETIEKLLEKHNYKMAFKFSPSGYVTKDSDIYAIPRIKIDGTKTLNDLKKWLN